MAKKEKSFYVGDIELKVGENDSFVEERNFFDEENGRLIKTVADGGQKNVIETIYGYDEKGRNTKIISKATPKVKLISPKGANPALNPALNNFITVELNYDDRNRIIEVIRNGLLAETFEYAKTGRVTHMTYMDENYGVCVIKEVIDKDGNIVSKVVNVNQQQLSKFSSTCIRGVYSETHEQRTADGTCHIIKIRYRKIDGKPIMISNSEISSVNGFRSSKEVMEVKYNDNNDIEYMKTKEVVNGMVDITERKYIYRNKKLHSIVDGTGHELVSLFIKNRYDVVRSLPTDLDGMLHHLYDYSIVKETKKCNYEFNGNTREMHFYIEHAESSKDQFKFTTEFNIGVNVDRPNIDIHLKKDDMYFDLLHDETGYIVVIQYLDKDTKKVVEEVRHKSDNDTIFNTVYKYIMVDHQDEVEKFITDVRSIIK